MKKFLLIAAACCFAASAVVAGTMLASKPLPPISTPKPAVLVVDDSQMPIFTNTGSTTTPFTFVSTASGSGIIMIANGGYSVINGGAFDVNCHPQRNSTRELMAANETPGQIAGRNVPRSEQLAAKE